MFHQSSILTRIFLILLASFIAPSHSQTPSSLSVEIFPKVATDSVKIDADDPAIWVHPTDPTKSVVIGTDKTKAEGGLYVWNLNGKQIQYIKLMRPNNVDVRHGMKLNHRTIDIAVTNFRKNQTIGDSLVVSKEIKVFEIDPVEGTLSDITTDGGIPTPEIIEDNGLCLYRRPADGAVFVIESSKEEEADNGLHQYRLLDDGNGKVKAVYVRAFGQGTIFDKVEGLVADDELGYVYAADEEAAIRKYHADPDKGENGQIAQFALDEDGFIGDREGLAIYYCDSTTGYLLVSNQKKDNIKAYRREGNDGNPHDHDLLFTLNTIGSRKSDGLDISSRLTTPEFPHGLLIKHDSPARGFKLYSWQDIINIYSDVCSPLKTERQ